MFEPVLQNPWVRAGAALAAVVLALFLVYLLSPVLVPLFFAFLVAYVLDPVVDWMETLKIPRHRAVALLAVIGIAILLAVPLLLVPSIIAQADGLVRATARGLDDAGGLYGWMVEQLPLRELVVAMDWEPEDVADYDPMDVIALHVAEWVRGPAVEFLRAHAAQLATAGQTAGVGITSFFGAIGRFFLETLLFLGNLALFSFVAAYLLKDFDGIVAEARSLVPTPYRARVSEIFRKIDRQLRGFLRGQFIVALCLGTMYAIGLTIAGVPFAILIGAFGVLASFVPYFGIVLTVIPSVVLCLMQHQGLDWHLAVVAATFLLAQLLEGTVLTPKIVGDQVGLGPVWVILAVLVFGSFLGFLGLLLAVPIAAALKVLVVEALARYRQSGVYTGRESET